MNLCAHLGIESGEVYFLIRLDNRQPLEDFIYWGGIGQINNRVSREGLRLIFCEKCLHGSISFFREWDEKQVI